MKKRVFLSVGIFFCIGCLGVWYINFYMVTFSKSHIYNSVDSLPNRKTGLVLGARVMKNGKPSDILSDRLDGAANAYKNKKIQHIIVSGDNSKEYYDEPTSMQKYLIDSGVAKENIFLDYAGFDTYDSLYRARDIFGASQLTVFTQSFHLPRTIFIGKKLGIKTVGLATDYHLYTSEKRNVFRESLARVKAWLDIYIWKSKPKFLGEKIIIK